MIVRAEPLERSLLQLFLELGMSDGDDQFGTFLQRSSVQVHRSVFRHEPVDVVARGDGPGT